MGLNMFPCAMSFSICVSACLRRAKLRERGSLYIKYHMGFLSNIILRSLYKTLASLKWKQMFTFLPNWTHRIPNVISSMSISTAVLVGFRKVVGSPESNTPVALLKWRWFFLWKPYDLQGKHVLQRKTKQKKKTYFRFFFFFSKVQNMRKHIKTFFKNPIAWVVNIGPRMWCFPFHIFSC